MTREPDAMPSTASDPWELLKAARAEIERLLGVCKDKTELLKDAYAEVERLKAENERLKEIEIKYDQLISGAFV